MPSSSRKPTATSATWTPGVVDVVLNLDLASQEAQQPAERVAERGVAQVADVRGLVRVDGGVLDDGLVAGGRPPPPGRVEPGVEMMHPIEEKIDVAVGRRLDPRDALDLAEGAGQLLRDRARRLAQPSRQLECERHRQIAERAARRNVDHDRGERRVVRGNAIEAGTASAIRVRTMRWTGRIMRAWRLPQECQKTSMIRSRNVFDSTRPSRWARS